MTLYYEDDSVTVHHGDCLDVLRELPDASIDAVVTDPPYGLGFMSREWDKFLASQFEYWCVDWATECLRVLKPGGHLLAFGGTRTAHRLAAGIEDAGFEIRDSIAWLYGSGFPKSLNLPGGLGTALKPAHEPIVVARKPLAGTVAATVLEWGTGALNIDATRVAHVNDADLAVSLAKNPGRDDAVTSGVYGADRPQQSVNTAGRWPPNVVLDQSQAAVLDTQSGVSRDGVAVQRNGGGQRIGGDGIYNGSDGLTRDDAGYGGEGGPSRFFPVFKYEPKAGSAERPRVDDAAHATVKPLDLMRWLVRLVTPPGGTVLDPFAGSGTTAEACIIEGFKCITIEREAEYLPLIVARLSKPIQVALDFDDEAAR